MTKAVPSASKPTNKKNIFIISLGCPRNLVDTEVLVGLLKKTGYNVIYEYKEGCIAIINTCGFIKDAKTESIDMILKIAELRKKKKIKALLVMGCLSQRYSKELMKDMPEIDAVFGSSTFTSIPDCINKIITGEKIVMVEKEPNFLYHHEMPRSIMTPRHSVYVKVQEGCMNFCSYCAIPSIRGRFRSRELDSVLEEIASFRKHSAKEINIIGQDTTLYGVDRYKKSMLAELLKKASKIMKDGWIRLLYTHPAHYNKDLLDVIRDEASICKYLDLPIQHISDKILKRMNRHVKSEDIKKLIDAIRKKIPGVAIRTSVIVGFPGETKEDFLELLNFLKETRFDRLGAFIYSREEGTKAYDFRGHISESEKGERLHQIMEAQKEVSLENNKKYLGKTLKVLIEEKDTLPGQYIGRTEYDAPEVDGTIYVKSKKQLKNGDFVNAKIEDFMEYDLIGEA